MSAEKNSFFMFSWSETFTQDEDTCSGRKNCFGEPVQLQDLTLEAVASGKNEHYLVIETDRWALNVDEIDEFCQLLKDFMDKELVQKKK